MKHQVVFWISVYVSMLYSVRGSPDTVEDISRSNSSDFQNSNDSFFESVAQTVGTEQNNYTQSSSVVTETVSIIIPDEAECTNWDECSSSTLSTNLPFATSSTVKQNLFTAITWASKHHNNVSDGKKLTETDDYNNTSLIDFNSNALMNFSNSNSSLSHNSSSIDYEILLSRDNELDSEIRNVGNSLKTADGFASPDVNSSYMFFETTPSTRNISDSLIFRTSFGDNLTTVQSLNTSEKNKSTIPYESDVDEVEYYETASEMGHNVSSTEVPWSTDASLFLNEIQNTTTDYITPKPELGYVGFTTTRDLLFADVEDNEIKATNFLSALHSVSINATEISTTELSHTTPDTSSSGSVVTAEMDAKIPRITSTTTATPAITETRSSSQYSHTSPLTEDRNVTTLKQGVYDGVQDTFTNIDIVSETYTGTFSTTEEHVDTRTNKASIHLESRSHDVFHNDLINFENANISDNNVLANVSSDDWIDHSASFVNISAAVLYNSHDQLSYQNLKSNGTPLKSNNPALADSQEKSINAILQENFTSPVNDSFPTISDVNTELPVNASTTLPFLITFTNVPLFASESVPDSTVEQNSLSSSTSDISSTEFNAQKTVGSIYSSTIYDSISDHTVDTSLTTENGSVSTSTNVERQSDSYTETYRETLQTTESSINVSTMTDFNSSQRRERYETTDEDNIIFTATDDSEHRFSTSSNTMRLEETTKLTGNSTNFTTVIISAPDHKDIAYEETEENTSTKTKIFMLNTSSTTTSTEIYKESENLNVLNATTSPNETTPSSTVKPMQTYDDITYSTTAETHREGKHIDFNSTRTKSDAVSSTVTIMPSIISTELLTTKGIVELLYNQIKIEDLSQMESDNMITAVIHLPRQNYIQEEIEMKFIIFNHWLLQIMTETFKNISLNSSDASNDRLVDKTENIPQVLYIFPTPKMKFTNITFTFVIRYPWKNGTLPYSLLLPILKLYCANLKELMNATAADFFHAVPEENLDFLSVVMEKYGTLVFIICITAVGIVILLLCIVVYHRRKTRQSAHYLTENKLHRNIQEAVGIDLNPAVLILQDEVREKSALNGNKICSLEDDEGWLAPYGDVPVAEDIQAPVVQDTKL